MKKPFFLILFLIPFFGISQEREPLYYVQLDSVQFSPIPTGKKKQYTTWVIHLDSTIENSFDFNDIELKHMYYFISFSGCNGFEILGGEEEYLKFNSDGETIVKNQNKGYSFQGFDLLINGQIAYSICSDDFKPKSGQYCKQITISLGD